MKKTILPTICILLCTLCIVFVPTEAEAAIYEDTLRLHILAPSDSAEDQALKLLIRDKVLEKYGSAIESAASSLEAKSDLIAKKDAIEEDCKAWILNTGYDYSVKVEVCEEWFNTREYGKLTLPAGSYAALKITLGEGDGQNWWCVMYPPLCLEAALGDERQTNGELNGNYSYEEERLITAGGYRIKFKLLEVASSVFKK